MTARSMFWVPVLVYGVSLCILCVAVWGWCLGRFGLGFGWLVVARFKHIRSAYIKILAIYGGIDAGRMIWAAKIGAHFGGRLSGAMIGA